MNNKLYTCNCCAYSTSKLENFKRHKETQKHAENVNNSMKYVCSKCKLTFDDRHKKFRHQHNCKILKTEQQSQNIGIELIKFMTSQQEIMTEFMKSINNKASKRIENLENRELKHIETIEKIATNVLETTKISTNTTNKSINILKHEPKTIKPIQKKSKIPHALKMKVWDKWIGTDIGKTKCLCCNVIDITQMSFACGHVVAESKGGELVVDNLKPICGTCNSSMGTNNMDEFIKKYNLGIEKENH